MGVNYDAPIIVRDGRNGGWLWVDKEVWSDERLSASDKVTYGTLAYFANNKTQKLYPSITVLEQFSKLSRRQIYKSIKVLETLNYVHVTRKRGKPNEYTLIDDAILSLKTTGAKNALVHTVHPTSANNAPPKRGQLVQNNTTNKNYIEQDLYNKSVNDSYKKEVDNIISWAYTRSVVIPSMPRESFRRKVERAIATHGYEYVRRRYASEENALRFITNI